MAEQLSMKAALPFAKSLAKASYRSSNTGPNFWEGQSSISGIIGVMALCELMARK